MRRLRSNLTFPEAASLFPGRGRRKTTAIGSDGLAKADGGEARIGIAPGDDIQEHCSGGALGLSEDKELYPYMTVNHSLQPTLLPQWRDDLNADTSKTLICAKESPSFSKGYAVKRCCCWRCPRVRVADFDEPTDGLDPVMAEEPHPN